MFRLNIKLLLNFSIILIALVAVSSAQRCAGRVRNPSCSGARNAGRRGFRCGALNMWHYDAALRQCRPFRYRGCGGNNNRWCTMAQCQMQCVR